MKKLWITIIVLVLIFTSCEKTEKIYLYTEEAKYDYFIKKNNYKEDIEYKEDTIKATNDSIAFCMAFEKYCIRYIASSITNQMQSSDIKVVVTPLSYKLKDNKGHNITGDNLFNKQAVQLKIIEDLNKRCEKPLILYGDGQIRREGDFVDHNKPADTARIKELEKHFTIKKDEFSSNNKIWYKPKSAPQYTNMNGIYCYFQTENGRASNLRFRVQYFAEDWLFFSKIQFAIDGNAYEYIPIDMETDHGYEGHIWEWFDESVSSYDEELLNALANAKSAKMKFIGRQYYNIKTITQQQILDINRTLELYKALGGNY